VTRLGIIGVGGYGRVNLDGFLALQEEGRVEINALADNSAGRLDELASPALRRARRFTDYRELLATPHLDAVVINAPIPLHREITLAALQRDLFVLLEKPPVALLSDLDELMEADSLGRVMVGFQHIYSPLIQHLKKQIVAGQFGKLESIAASGVWPRHSAYYARSGWAGELAWNGEAVFDGPCTNGFAHYLNLALYLADNNVDGFALPVRLSGEAYRARPGLASYDTGCIGGVMSDDVRFLAGFSHAGADLSRVAMRIRCSLQTVSLAQDCEALHLPDGSVLKGSDGRDDMRRDFLGFASGDLSLNRTPLPATRPFVATLDNMLFSSGGIHEVPAEFVRKEGFDGDTIYSINGIRDLLRKCADDLVMLSETDAPWGKMTPSVKPGDFSEIELLRLMGLTPAAA
jgi:predicted dehydrogenase